jgi:acetyl esterase/lipase
VAAYVRSKCIIRLRANINQILTQGGPIASLDATTDIQALRATLLERKRALTALAGPPTSSISETDHRINTRDGQEIVVRVYRGPQSDNGPVMVMLHGGGFVLGGLDNEEVLCRKWCEEAGGVSVNVEYRLAPEFKFPIPVFDCCDAVKWTAENTQIHGGDLSKGFIVAGISAGANLGCVVSHLARDEGWAKLTGVYLSIPSVLSPQAVPEKWQAEYKSREENEDAPILNKGAIALFRGTYSPVPRVFNHT